MIYIFFSQLLWKKILHGPNNFVLMMHKAMGGSKYTLYSLNIIVRNMQVRLSWTLKSLLAPWLCQPHMMMKYSLDSIKLGENTWPHSCLTQNNSISVHESMQPKVSERKCTWQFSTNWNYYWPDWWDRKASKKQTKKCTFLFIQGISINRT